MTPHREHPPVARRSRGVDRSLKLALLTLALIGGFYLLREHWTHLADNWVYLLLACPLIHLFHGHRGHAGRNDRSSPGPRGNKED